MSKTVIGGIVYRDDQTESQAAIVEKIEFPTVATAASVTKGAQGTLYLTNTPPVIGHYDSGNTLVYRDSNHHNDSIFRVDANIGPTKYTITVTEI